MPYTLQLDDSYVFETGTMNLTAGVEYEFLADLDTDDDVDLGDFADFQEAFTGG